MRLLLDVLWVLRAAVGWQARYSGPGSAGVTGPGMGRRELVQAMRHLPGRYADRLGARTLDRIAGASASGQWERAVKVLIAALHTRAQPITLQEREELRALLQALDLPGERVDKLTLHP